MIGRAVAEVAAEPEDHAAIVDRQAGSLEQRGRGRPCRIDTLAQRNRPAVQVEAHQLVCWGTADQFVCHDEDLSPGLVNDGRAGDADRRGDVTAGKRAGRHGRPDVRGPQHGSRAGRQRFHGVVFGGHVDPATRDERLTVQLAIEGGRRPCGRGEVDGGDRRGCTVPVDGAVIDGPRWRGGGRRRAERRTAPRHRQERGSAGESDASCAPQRSTEPAGNGLRPRSSDLSGATWSPRPRQRAGRRRWRYRSRPC